MEPCLCIKSAVFRATLPMKLGCMNVKMNLGPLLKLGNNTLVKTYLVKLQEKSFDGRKQQIFDHERW